jgi:hypothetical protein
MQRVEKNTRKEGETWRETEFGQLCQQAQWTKKESLSLRFVNPVNSTTFQDSLFPNTTSRLSWFGLVQIWR